MKRNDSTPPRPLRGAALAVLLAILALPLSADPIGTAFTYQGELQDGGALAQGSFDIRFALYAQATGGSEVDRIDLPAVEVVGGRFSALLDFTEIPFADDSAWHLQIAVREAGVGTHETLSPRQPITPAPYANVALGVRPGGVDAAALAPLSVGSEQLVDGAVLRGHLANGAVNALKLQDDSVTTEKIANNSVTEAKLAFPVGDVSAVTAGFGLVGGGSSGSVSLSVDSNIIQRRITGTCGEDEYLRGVTADGDVICGSLR